MVKILSSGTTLFTLKFKKEKTYRIGNILSLTYTPVVPKVLGSFTVFPNQKSLITGMSDINHTPSSL